MRPFTYLWSEGPLHALHPLAKLTALLAASWAAMSVSPAALFVPAAAALALLAAAGARPRDVAHNARFLLPMTGLVLAMRLAAPLPAGASRIQALVPALLYAARLSLVFLHAEAFYRSTSPGELAAAATRCARALTGRGDLDPGIYVSLVVGFIPRLFAAWERSREAAVARGWDPRRPGLHGSSALLASFSMASLRSALATAWALEARCYSAVRTLSGTRFRPGDALFAVGSLALAAASLAM
jgi:energy-coupling factor transporter transmembrane protein EcfT